MQEKRKRRGTQATVDGVSITHPERELWPEEGITKGELARYYQMVADYLVRYTESRPLTLRPFPRGITGPSFWVQDAPQRRPEFVRTWRRIPPATGRPIDMVLGGDRRTLLWLAQYNVIEVHAWLSRIDRPDRPDIAALDLDAHSGAPFSLVVRAAQLAGQCLERMGLVGFPKLSGVSGLHVLVPIERRYTFEQVRSFVRRLGADMSGLEPETVTTDAEQARRHRRIHVDYAQNAEGKTLVAPYSVRPGRGAPVSAPIGWEELDETELRGDSWTIRNMAERIERVGDLMAPAHGLAQRLPI